MTSGLAESLSDDDDVPAPENKLVSVAVHAEADLEYEPAVAPAVPAVSAVGPESSA